MNEKTNGSAKVLSGNDQYQVIGIRKDRYASGLPVTVARHDLQAFDHRANFALQCIEKWAMVSAEPDGEDSCGRSRMRRATPDEIVSHAISCSEKAFAAFEQKGWALTIPPYSEVLDSVKDYENSND